MKYAIVYESRTGNTEKCAKKLRDRLGEKCIYYGRPQAIAEDADVLLVGFWTDKGSCPEEISEFLRHLSGKKVAFFGTAGFGGSPEYFAGILARVKQELPAGNQTIGEFMCQGEMPEAVGIRYRKMLETDPLNAQAKMFLENFERAKGHPGEKEFLQIEEWLEEIEGKVS